MHRAFLLLRGERGGLEIGSVTKEGQTDSTGRIAGSEANGKGDEQS